MLVYVSTPIPILERLQSMWNEQYPDVRFESIRADQGESRNRFLTESRGGRHSADILAVDEVSELILSNENLITPYRPPGISLTPAAMTAADSMVGVPWRGIGMGYAVNTSMVAEPPPSWDSLSRSGDLVVWPDPRAGGGAYDLFIRLYETFGADMLERMGENLELRASVIAANEAFASGEFPVLVGAYHYLVKSAAASGNPVEFVVPRDGTNVYYTREAVATNAAHPAAARLYISFILSETVQQFLTQEQFFIPVNAEVAASDPLTIALTDENLILMPQPDLKLYGETDQWAETISSVFQL
ncbi:ABC transporter substrate-binding protein [Rhodococcus opacus]|uniref:ABC transporter substrate-binding protein n=1 Tax=Rhodococcus opacus TaxID=37919 RepID=UPI002473C6D3|nr:extracellular solute-binding protein [Rhodococcus opacus]